MVLELVSRPHFFIKSFDNFSFVILHKLAKLPDCIYYQSYLAKCVSCFMPRHFMTSWLLNIWNVKIWLSQEQKEFSKWNKKHLPLFHKCSLLDWQNKLATMQWTQPLTMLFFIIILKILKNIRASNLYMFTRYLIPQKFHPEKAKYR